MSKKRRTKKEKLIAQLRRQQTLSKPPEVSNNSHNHPHTHVEPQKAQYSFITNALFTKKTKADEEQEPKVLEINNYSHVIKDARQTLLVTAVIIAFHVILFVGLQNKIFSLSVFGI